MKQNFLYLLLYFLMFIIHFILFRFFVNCCETEFLRYYIFLSLLFIMVLTIMSIFKRLFPNYLGFVFMGLVLIKLSLMFLIMNKLHLHEIPYYKIQFILPYLLSLVLETLYSANLIQKGEKNQ